MNCNKSRHQLSQCLDGRLPSGQRALVLRHTESCAGCRAFWAELQAMQQVKLRLRQPQVGSDFRARLWERIRAGEGSPAAVFREPIPVLTRIRYTLTGAAAAAATLLGATSWLGGRQELPTGLDLASASRPGVDAAAAPPATIPAARGELTPYERTASAALAFDPSGLGADPLVWATRRLTFDLVAVEAARQLEQRYLATTDALRRIDGQRGNSEPAIRQAIENADDFRSFGEMLLDLRDHRRLFFTDAETDADLRFAINMLGQRQLRDGGMQAVMTFVAPAFRSPRLASVSRAITLAPTTSQREETEVLMRLNRLRPEVFPKLFFVLGNDDEMRQLGQWRNDFALVMDDVCGPSWVAPRSEVESRAALLQVIRRK